MNKINSATDKDCLTVGDEQARFEAWARSIGASVDADEHGNYLSSSLNCSKLGWDAALAALQPVGQSFQAGVSEWMDQCFLPSLYSNMTERGDRLLEEVLELLQAHGYNQGRVATLVDYVFGRPVGEPAQEVGGVMVTLAGYCWVAGLDMHTSGDAELQRIMRPEVMAKIRRKQEAKNALHFDTPLPGGAAAPARAVDIGQPNDPGRTLYVDLDGVMADFDGAFPAVFGLDHRSMADDAMWGHINSHPSFFRDLPPMDGAVAFFRSIEHLNPVILTACPKSNYPHVAAQKRAWVREHLSQTCLVLPVMGGRHKPLFMHQPGDVLIDDFGRNCEAWGEAGGIAIKHEGDWTATRQALALVDTQPTLATATPPQDLRTKLGEP